MRFRKIIVISAFVALSLNVLASDFKVKGTVVDTAGVAEPFATVRVYNLTDSVKPVYMGVSGENGHFEQKLDKKGEYRLTVNLVGKSMSEHKFKVSAEHAIANLDTIVMKEDLNILGEVEVVAQRPLVTREIDRIGYDVQADADSKTSTVIEMLRKVPMVSVDGDDKITVRGSSDFKIYKNGRPNNTFSNNPKEVLSSIPASMIKRIEVITEPGSRYDAEGVGAIINIVTIDNAAVKGVLGNASISSNSNNPVPRPNLWLTSQIDKVTMSINAGYSYMNSRETEWIQEDNYDYKDSGSALKNRSQGDNPGDLMYVALEASYEPDTLNLFNVEFGGYYYDVNATGLQSTLMSDGNDNPIYSYTNRYNFPSYRYFDFSGNLNYQRLTKRKGEAITLSYMISTTNQARDQYIYYYDKFNAPFEYDENKSAFDLNFIEHTFQADWTRPIVKAHQIDLGAKYILRDNNSVTTQEYVDFKTMSSDFSHITNIAAVYADYRVNMGRWSARAGMRYEYSHLKAEYKDGSNPDFSQNLSDWVPSASLSWRLNASNNFTLNYATRINRPGISYLNPAIEESPTSTTQGNPNLESARHSSVKLSYMYISPKINVNLSTGYEFSDNEITAYNYVEDNHIYHTYGNIGDRKSWLLSGYMQWAITPKTRFMLNANASYNRYANSALNNSLSRWQIQGYGQFSQQLPWNLKFDASVHYANGYAINAYTYSKITKGAVYHSLSLQRPFLKENRLTVKLSVNNPFGPGTSEYGQYIVNGDYTGTSVSMQQNRRSVALTVSYRFGSLNAKVKKTAKAIENDDLIGRKK